MVTDSQTAAVLDAVRDIVPRLRDNGRETEDRRWIVDENLDLLEKAGVFRTAVPRRFGGMDLSLADQAAVLSEIARGCPSTGWVSMVWVSSAWLATLYPDKAQEEIFANGSVRISGGFNPTGSVVAVEGGYRLNGSWRFNSGCRGADWNIAAAIRHLPDGTEDEVVAIVPMSEFTITDDWHTSSAAGTGSCMSTATDLFVPEHRLVTFGEAMFNVTEGRDAPVTPGRAYGLFSFVIASAVASYLGIAKGALELFLQRVKGRGITYTSWTDQSAHPLTQVNVATAAGKIAAAQALHESWMKLLQERADAGEQPTMDEKAVLRGQLSFAIQLAKEAVEILFTASGASVIHRDVAMQRFHRDIQGLAMHAMLVPSTNLELYGRVLLGLDPDSPLL